MKATQRVIRQVEGTFVLTETEMAQLAACLYLTDDGVNRHVLTGMSPGRLQYYRGRDVTGLTKFRHELHDKLIDILENHA